MIPKPYIAKWQQYAPWKEFAQVEQDLIISRALIDLYNITNKFGLRKALNYQKRSIKAMFCNRAYKEDVIRFNN